MERRQHEVIQEHGWVAPAGIYHQGCCSQELRTSEAEVYQLGDACTVHALQLAHPSHRAAGQENTDTVLVS